MISGQVIIFVTQMIFPELACGITQGLEKLCKGWVLLVHTKFRTRHAYFGEAGTETTLASNK